MNFAEHEAFLNGRNKQSITLVTLEVPALKLAEFMTEKLVPFPFGKSYDV